jgi:hypothetical protein
MLWVDPDKIDVLVRQIMDRTGVSRQVALLTVPLGDLELCVQSVERDLVMVMKQAEAHRDVAVVALNASGGDIVNAIIHLTRSYT